MAKPRIFVSSTYYDLRHIRNSLESFIQRFGYEPVLFENGSIPFHHNETLIENCYSEVGKCHMLVLIIGGRYGSNADNASNTPEDGQKHVTFNSVTKGEYERAKSRNIPIFIFVERGVKAEYETYKNNRGNDTIKYVHVDDVNVFGLLDSILSGTKNNFVREFDRFDDIVQWLTEQWAGLFAEFLVKDTEKISLKSLENQLESLSEITSTLKNYSESIMGALPIANSEKIISDQNKRLQANSFKKFSSEPLIAYIRERTNSPDELLFSAANNSTSFLEFSRNAGLEKELIGSVFSQPKIMKSAESDFQNIREKYFPPIPN